MDAEVNSEIAYNLLVLFQYHFNCLFSLFHFSLHIPRLLAFLLRHFSTNHVVYFKSTYSAIAIFLLQFLVLLHYMSWFNLAFALCVQCSFWNVLNIAKELGHETVRFFYRHMERWNGELCPNFWLLWMVWNSDPMSL